MIRPEVSRAGCPVVQLEPVPLGHVLVPQLVRSELAMPLIEVEQSLPECFSLSLQDGDLGSPVKVVF